MSLRSDFSEHLAAGVAMRFRVPRKIVKVRNLMLTVFWLLFFFCCCSEMCHQGQRPSHRWGPGIECAELI